MCWLLIFRPFGIIFVFKYVVHTIQYIITKVEFYILNGKLRHYGKKRLLRRLGVERGADEKEIKRAYKKLAMQYHPDRTKGDKEKEEKFKEIQEAYEILSDKQKRANYDQYGHAAFEQGFGAGSGFGGADFGDIFGDMFGDIFGGGGRGRQRVVRGDDLRYDLEITLEEAVKGTTKDIKIHTLAPCETCHGTGAEAGSKVETCPHCHGSGRLRRQQGFFCD